MSGARVRRRLAAILSADVAGWSRLAGADEEGALGTLTRHIDKVITPCITEHGGRLVKTTGDGLLAEFPSVVDALRCALEWQTSITRLEADTQTDRRFAFRIGINLGDIILQGGDIFGDGVNVAARLESLAQPGGICISNTVRDQVAGQMRIAMIDMGEQRLKNIERPLRAWHIQPGGENPPPVAARHGRTRRVTYALVLAGLFAAVPLLWFQIVAPWFEPQPQGQAAVASTGSSDVPAIAVLPLVNLSGDESQDVFADGMSEDILVDLSRTSRLLVIARGSAFAYRNTNLPTAEIAKQLGVQYVLTGSVRRENGRLRVNVELAEAGASVPVWTARFDRSEEDVFDVRDEITGGIAQTLVSQITQAEILRMRSKPPARLDAWESYLRGLDLFRARATRPPWGKTLEESRRFLMKAVELDPDFGLAWAVLADNYVSAWIQNPKYEPLQHEHQNPETLEKALDAARRATLVAPNLADGHAKIGWVLHWMRQPEDAQNAYRTAFEINPNLIDDAYPNALIKFGRHADAETYLLRLIRLDPNFGRNFGNLGLARFMQDDLEAAHASLQDCKRLAIGWRACNIWDAATLVGLDRDEQAEVEVSRVLEDDPGFSVARYIQFEPYSNADDALRLSEALEAAGFPP